jgi:hypothetical protein
MPKLTLTIYIHLSMVFIGQLISCTAKLFIYLLPGEITLIVGISLLALATVFLALFLFANDYLPLEFMHFPLRKYLYALVGCGFAGFLMGFFAV